MEMIKGKVSSLRAVSTHTAHLEIDNTERLIELTTHEPWAIDIGDYVRIAGEIDEKSGKFKGYAYNNISKKVFGRGQSSRLAGALFIIVGIVLIWAVFPLYHIYIGIKTLAYNHKCSTALAMVRES